MALKNENSENIWFISWLTPESVDHKQKLRDWGYFESGFRLQKIVFSAANQYVNKRTKPKYIADLIISPTEVTGFFKFRFCTPIQV